jgi:hypothetical protein
VKVPNAGATLHQSHHKESKGACTHPDLPRDTLSPHLFRAYNVDRLVRSAGERNKSSIKTAGFNTTWNINYTFPMSRSRSLFGNESSFTKSKITT